MNKRIIKCLMATVLAVSMMASLTGCTSSDKKEVEEKLQIDLTEANVLSKADSHGGFNGDGTLVISYDCSAAPLNVQLDELKKWQKFPIANVTKRLIVGKVPSQDEPIFTNEDGSHILPDIENGYYFFEDSTPREYRRTGQKEQELQVAEGVVIVEDDYIPLNFVFAIYDTDNNILYYVKADS